MQNYRECFEKVRKDCVKYIQSQETKKEKFKNKDQMIKSHIIPLCFWINKKRKNKKTLLVGLAGGQGTGKTTISTLLRLVLTKYFKLQVFKISIDDFYKTRKERIALSKKIHPMLLTRGVPGTHDINMMLDFFKKSKSKKFKKMKLPNFNKAIDDRFPTNKWNKINKRPDVIIFEGWCVGARSEVAEGVIVREGSVLSMGVYLSSSTPIVNRETGEIIRGEVPPYSVLIPGTFSPNNDNTKPSLYCAVIVKIVDEKTRSKTSINELLRD